MPDRHFHAAGLLSAVLLFSLLRTQSASRDPDPAWPEELEEVLPPSGGESPFAEVTPPSEKATWAPFSDDDAVPKEHADHQVFGIGSNGMPHTTLDAEKWRPEPTSGREHRSHVLGLDGRPVAELQRSDLGTDHGAHGRRETLHLHRHGHHEARHLQGLQLFSEHGHEQPRRDLREPTEAPAEHGVDHEPVEEAEQEAKHEPEHEAEHGEAEESSKAEAEVQAGGGAEAEAAGEAAEAKPAGEQSDLDKEGREALGMLGDAMQRGDVEEARLLGRKSRDILEEEVAKREEGSTPETAEQQENATAGGKAGIHKRCQVDEAGDPQDVLKQLRDCTSSLSDFAKTVEAGRVQSKNGNDVLQEELRKVGVLMGQIKDSKKLELAFSEDQNRAFAYLLGELGKADRSIAQLRQHSERGE